MESNRINTEMSGIDIAIALSDNNQDIAMKILNLLKGSESGIEIALILDHYHIYGENIIKFFKFCCGEIPENFYNTLKILNFNIFDENKIQKNLALNSPIVFVDEELKSKLFAPNSFGDLRDYLLFPEITNTIRQNFYERLENQVSLEVASKIASEKQPGADE